MAGLRLEIEGELGNITLKAFTDAIEASLSILKDLDTAISRESGGSLEWVVTGLGEGSLVVGLESRSKIEDRNVGPQVAKAFVEGLDRVENEGTSPPYASEAGLRQYRRLIRLIGRGGTAGFVATHLAERVEVSPQASVHIDQLLPVRQQSQGSVEGRIEMISIHRKPRFTVYLAGSRKAVTCHIVDQAMIDRAKETLGHRVLVTGLVRSNARGEPISVVVDAIRALRSGTHLPSPAELLGLDPSYTGSLSSDEYVRSLRVG